MPATTRPMQKARKANSARPARCAEAAIATTSTAGRIVPAADSDSVDGTAPKTDADSALIAVSVIAASSASAPRERGHAEPGRHVASTIRKPPQPTRAAAWLKKVADGATLNAIRVGTATAKTAPRASAQAGTGAGSAPVAGPTTGGRSLQGCLTVTGDAIRLGSRWGMRVLASKRGMIRAPSSKSR